MSHTYKSTYGGDDVSANEQFEQLTRTIHELQTEVDVVKAAQALRVHSEPENVSIPERITPGLGALESTQPRIFTTGGVNEAPLGNAVKPLATPVWWNCQGYLFGNKAAGTENYRYMMFRMPRGAKRSNIRFRLRIIWQKGYAFNDPAPTTGAVRWRFHWGWWFREESYPILPIQNFFGGAVPVISGTFDQIHVAGNFQPQVNDMGTVNDVTYSSGHNWQFVGDNLLGDSLIWGYLDRDSSHAADTYAHTAYLYDVRLMYDREGIGKFDDYYG
jgi:hypothetical protein